MKLKILQLLMLALGFTAMNLNAKNIEVSCGASEGYLYFFKGGLVGDNNKGFQKDEIKNGQFKLIMDANNEGEVLFKDGSGELKSVSSQGGFVQIFGTNWVIYYPDGVLEVYSYHPQSSKVLSYRNTVGNIQVAKNSLMESDCYLVP